MSPIANKTFRCLAVTGLAMLALCALHPARSQAGEVPKFEDHPASETLDGRAAKIDTGSEAWVG